MKRLDDRVVTKQSEQIVESINIPCNVLRDRTLKVLEVLVEFLKDEKGMNYREIGGLLNRDERTIWTVYSRAVKKRARKRDEGVYSR